MREAWKNPERLGRRAEAHKQRWQNQEMREHFLETIRDACAKPIVCVETGEVFEMETDAAKTYGICRANISRAIKTGYKCGGFHWKYYNKNDIA